MKSRAQLLQHLALPLALLAICAFFALREPAFLGPRNLTQLIVEFSITGTLALGMFMILLTGQIDLSVGSGVGLIGGIAAVLVFKHDWPAAGALAAGFAAALVVHAHARGLAVAQKNDVDMLALQSVTRFDFAVVEECQVYSECSAYTRVYGRNVIEIEYSDAGGRANFNAACSARGSRISIVYRDRDLVVRGKPGYVFATC